MLRPLAYHQQMVAFLKKEEPELWTWASSAAARDDFSASVRTELLKNNYRLDAEEHADLAQRTAKVAERLGIAAPVTLYQANGGLGMNAMLCRLPGEAHVIFSGPILTVLRGAELDAVLAHELAHYHLWDLENGDYLTAERLLSAAAHHPRASTSHIQSARRFSLYTEIYADRGALEGSGELEATVAALVKTETGLADVSGAAYLRQADEIFASENPVTEGSGHPETFIRARALRLWQQGASGVEEWLTQVIEGGLKVDALDLLGQQRLTHLTRRLFMEVLRPKWMQTPITLAHASATFQDFIPNDTPDGEIAATLRTADPGTQELLAYLLLDFATIDPELDEAALAVTLNWSVALGVDDLFEKIAAKEAGWGKRVLNRVKKQADEIIANAEVSA